MATPMMMLNEATALLGQPTTPAVAGRLLHLIGVPLPEDFFADARIYTDVLPPAPGRQPYTREQRLLHFIWDAFDKTPYSLAIDFSIPFRQLLAKRLFGKVGERFICESNVTFNFGCNLYLGNDVFFNRGVFIDAKGGVEIGDGVCLTEDVRIFTHGHSECLHTERSYAPVVIKPYAKIYTGATLLPGITVGAQGIVAAGALVNKDVPENTLVAGSPAKPLRERHNEGRCGAELAHIWLGDGCFQR